MRFIRHIHEIELRQDPCTTVQHVRRFSCAPRLLARLSARWPVRTLSASGYEMSTGTLWGVAASHRAAMA